MTNTYKHECPEWDDLEIDITDPEFCVCPCFPELSEEERNAAYEEIEKFYKAY